MNEERMFCVGLYLTKGGESAIVYAVLSLWIEGYILAGRHGAKRWIKCRWYPDGRYREEDLSSGFDPCDGTHLDLGVHLNEQLTKRLASAEAERDREKERRIHWQGLAYTGMRVVDAVLNNSIRLGEGTTEESMPVNAKMAIDKMNHLRREWAAKGGRE